MIQSLKLEKLIDMKIIQHNIEKSESISFLYYRKIQNRLSARRVRGRK